MTEVVVDTDVVSFVSRIILSVPAIEDFDAGALLSPQTNKEDTQMQRFTFLIFAALTASTAHVQAQGLLQAITTPEKAVATVNQTLEGTWLLELRRPGALGRLLRFPEGAVRLQRLALDGIAGRAVAEAVKSR